MNKDLLLCTMQGNLLSATLLSWSLQEIVRLKMLRLHYRLPTPKSTLLLKYVFHVVTQCMRCRCFPLPK